MAIWPLSPQTRIEAKHAHNPRNLGPIGGIPRLRHQQHRESQKGGIRCSFREQNSRWSCVREVECGWRTDQPSSSYACGRDLLREARRSIGHSHPSRQQQGEQRPHESGMATTLVRLALHAPVQRTHPQSLGYPSLQHADWLSVPNSHTSWYG